MDRVITEVLSSLRMSGGSRNGATVLCIAWYQGYIAHSQVHYLAEAVLEDFSYGCRRSCSDGSCTIDKGGLYVVEASGP